MVARILAAFLDVDGVICDSHKAITQCINAVLEFFGCEQIADDYFKQNPLMEFHNFWRGRGVSESIAIETIYERYDALACRPEIYRECPDIRAVLDYIKAQDVPIYLVSAMNDGLTELKIAHHDGLMDYVSGIRGGDDKSAAMLSLCADLGIAPENVLFITDMERDLVHSRNIGVGYEIAIVSDFSTREGLLAHTPHVADHHHHLLELVQQAFERSRRITQTNEDLEVIT